MSIATAEPTALAPAVPLGTDPLDGLYEVIDGRIVEKPPMAAYSVWIANILLSHLGAYAISQGLGRTVCEMLFDINPGKPQRRPDVAYVSYERWAKNRKVPVDNAWQVVPDLAVEVVSPSNTAEGVLSKVLEYFDAGVRLVWVIYPIQHLVQVFESPTLIRVVRRSEPLDGVPVLPGFQLPLSTLFDDAATLD